MKIVKFDGWDELEAGTAVDWSATAASDRHRQSDDARRIEWITALSSIASWFPSLAQARVNRYDAARHRAAIVDRSDRGRIVVSGKDRASYLQGLLTNDIAALSPGDGCYARVSDAAGPDDCGSLGLRLGDMILLVSPAT